MAFRTNKTPVLQEKTASGSVASFNCALNKPLTECVVSFSFTQSGIGKATPNNERPFVFTNSIGLNANSIPIVISLGDYYAQGYLNLTTGLLTLTYRIFKITNSINVVLMSTASGNQTFYFGAGNAVPNTAVSNLFSRSLDPTDEGYMVHTASQIYGVIDTSRLNPISSAGMKQWLIDNNAVFVYQYETPIEVQLTPTEISTIIGSNTFNTSGDGLSLTYNDLDIAKRGNFREVFKLPS